MQLEIITRDNKLGIYLLRFFQHLLFHIRLENQLD